MSAAPDTSPLPDGFHGKRWTLDSAPEAVPEARRLARQSLDGWAKTQLAEAAELLVSELVTNVLAHTGCRYVGLSLLHQVDALRIEVRDSSGALPCRLSLVPLAPGGRGLNVVDEFALRWGVTRVPFGKVVWVDLPSPRGHGPCCRRSPEAKEIPVESTPLPPPLLGCPAAA